MQSPYSDARKGKSLFSRIDYFRANYDRFLSVENETSTDGYFFTVNPVRRSLFQEQKAFIRGNGVEPIMLFD